jgi:hypothetical protein
MYLICYKNFFSQGLILFYILSLIFIYEICKHIQTYTNKAILSRGIANQCVRATGALEEEEQGCIYCRKVSLPPPHMDIYVTQYCRPELMVFRSIEVLSLAFSFSLHHPILEMRIQTIAHSPPINLSWFLLLLVWWISVHWRCKLEFLLDCLSPLAVWWRVVLLCLIAICQLSWWSRKERHWYLHESFISND